MNVRTVSGAGAVGATDGAVTLGGFLLTNTAAAGNAVIQDTAGRELAHLRCAADGSCVVMFPAPVHAIGINVTACTGNLNIYLE